MTKYEADKPIYLQIIDKLSKQIVRGELKPGDKLPSVREMAIQSGVNPNTIQRTYSEMERMDMVETKRGQGTFVVERESIVEQLKTNMEEKVVETFIKNMREIGIDDQQVVISVQKYLQEGGREDD
ncbi:MAG: GntR family transcriptional regulator [Bacillaceae bacterium]|nr:GntR family transcriptional regulator [Bacillaceae bacterium]